jgi:serine/threonine protein phosphatase 1
MSRYAMSDVHGCYKTFDALLDKIQLTKDDTLYLLGDLIDRGPGSKEVVDRVLQLMADGYQVDCLLGNHEWLLLNAPYDDNRMVNWLSRNGGAITLQSYNIYEDNYLEALPEAHNKFYKRLQYIIELDDYILVHAGINFKDEDPLSDYTSMLWIRDWQKYIQPELIGGKKIIHGHTPRLHTYLSADIKNPKVQSYNIDCGCVYHGLHFQGMLAAFNLDTREVIFQENIEDLALVP